MREAKFLFLVDDGWRYERRELLRYLKGKVSFDIATHDEATLRELGEEFRVLPLERFPLRRNPLYHLLMFFAKELDTNIARNVRRLRIRTSRPAMKLLYLLQSAAGKLGLRRMSYPAVLRLLYRRSDRYGSLLENYDALLFSPVLTVDKRIVFEAERKGLQVICSVFSWDNPMKDNEFLPDADRYLVWNEPCRRQLETLYGIPREKVDLVGPTQFDYLLEARERPPAEGERKGRYVLFACSVGVHDFWIDQEIELILMVRRILDEIDPGVLLLVRPYPFAARKSPYGALDGHPNIEIADFGSFREWMLDISRRDLEDKYVQMRDALCIVNVVSTIGLEASFTGTPILQVGFNLPNDLPLWQDLGEVMKNDHLALILDDSFPNVVRSEEDVRVMLREVLAGKEERYRPYTAMLQKFANPMEVEAYRECFLQALLRIAPLPSGGSPENRIVDGAGRENYTSPFTEQGKTLES